MRGEGGAGPFTVDCSGTGVRGKTLVGAGRFWACALLFCLYFYSGWFVPDDLLMASPQPRVTGWRPRGWRQTALHGDPSIGGMAPPTSPQGGQALWHLTKYYSPLTMCLPTMRQQVTTPGHGQPGLERPLTAGLCLSLLLQGRADVVDGVLLVSVFPMAFGVAVCAAGFFACRSGSTVDDVSYGFVRA